MGPIANRAQRHIGAEFAPVTVNLDLTSLIPPGQSVT